MPTLHPTRVIFIFKALGKSLDESSQVVTASLDFETGTLSNYIAYETKTGNEEDYEEPLVPHAAYSFEAYPDVGVYAACNDRIDGNSYDILLFQADDNGIPAGLAGTRHNVNTIYGWDEN